MVQVEVFWVMAPYRVVVGYHFRGPCWLNFHPEDGGKVKMKSAWTS